MQDKATLRSDLSGIQGYTGAALSVLLFFFAPVETQSDKPRGLRGGAPSSSPNDGSTETEKTMAKNSHLTLSDRIAIEVGLRERKSFSAIAEELGKPYLSVSD